jgi:hypothetical protein
MADVGRLVMVFKKSDAPLRGNATDTSFLDEDDGEQSFHRIVLIQCCVT